MGLKTTGVKQTTEINAKDYKNNIIQVSHTCKIPYAYIKYSESHIYMINAQYKPLSTSRPP